jgi:hypothetical protein
LATVDLTKIRHSDSSLYIILATWKTKTGRISVQGQPRQKVHKTPISTNDWVQSQVPVIPATWGSTNRRIGVQPGLNIKQGLIAKITNTERVGEVAQVIQHLP